MKKELLNAEYLKSRVTISHDGCWNWNPSLINGYGQIKNGGKHYRAHRLSYEIFVGEIPEGLQVCHRCDNPKCINPDHLFVGTSKDNMQDMVQKGRNKIVRKFGNNYSGKPVTILGTTYKSFTDAAKAFGISDNGIRKRIALGWYQ